MRAVAVYCGSSTGESKAFSSAAVSLGRALAEAELGLVYGGGSKGLMGIVSSSALQNNGNVIGIIPRAMLKKDHKEFVDDCNSNQKRMQTIYVDSMHERKVEIAMRADGFIALPGGYGTFEEVLEVTTWTQLGIHDKPVVLLNVLSFWEPLRALISQSKDAGFIRPENEQLIIIADGPANVDEHEGFDWGKAGLEALKGWESGSIDPLFNWSNKPSFDATVQEREYTYKRI